VESETEEERREREKREKHGLLVDQHEQLSNENDGLV
jgi:hypothetical protein